VTAISKAPTRLAVRTDDGATLAGEQAGERDGAAIVLLHGITATRRYVVMGSRLLERSGMRTIAYDARGHGQSSPAPDRHAYGYERLATDLLAVFDALDIEKAILAGASMGAHTIVRFALEHPERVAALGLITPAYPLGEPEAGAYASWDALAKGLREGGVDGFLAAYDFDAVPEVWRATVETVVKQRLSRHEHPEAVADALEVVPRSWPFEQIEDLAAIAAPTLIVASRDEADPSHPLAVGERYAEAISSSRLIVEEPGRSPIAWQGGQLSKALLGLAGAVRDNVQTYARDEDMGRQDV
jgi:pimeloyl-ACP methyl ester carboxylesterase